MKKTLLALGLAAATMPFTFAAQAPAAPASSSNPPAATSTTTPTKKHVKKAHHVKKQKNTPRPEKGVARICNGI